MAFDHTAVYLVMNYNGDTRSDHTELTDAVAAAEALIPDQKPGYIVHAVKVTEVP